MADVSKILVRSNLDLQKNKIYNGGFEVVTSLPTADFEGRQVYNSTDSKLYVCKKNTDGTFKWVAVGSNIKTISGDTAPTSADMTANDIANNEIFIWQDTTNSKSYLYQNVGGTPRKCGNEEQIQSDLSALAERVTTNEGAIETNKTDLSALAERVTTNETDIATNKTNIATNKTNITDLTNNRFKVFTYSIETLTLNTPMEISFSNINTDLTTVGGVTILIGAEEQILYTKIDNTNKEITITSNVTKSNIDLIVYGWVTKTETTTE